MTTLVTNGLCFVLTPFWLKLTTGSRVSLDPWDMAAQLLVVVLVPTALGQVCRVFRGPAGFATRHKTAIGVIAQSLILTIVFLAACKAGAAWKSGNELAARHFGPNVGGVALVWGTTIAVHLAAMWFAVLAAAWFGFQRGDRIAVAFAGSQKTLPIGVLLATDPMMFGNPDLLTTGVGVPFAVFPMLMYHATQLFLDTAVADRFAGQAKAWNPGA
jgi:sodium/bile acid cotransporter 7